MNDSRISCFKGRAKKAKTKTNAPMVRRKPAALHLNPISNLLFSLIAFLRWRCHSQQMSLKRAENIFPGQHPGIPDCSNAGRDEQRKRRRAKKESGWTRKPLDAPRPGNPGHQAIAGFRDAVRAKQ